MKCKKIKDGRPFPVFEFKYPDDPYAYVISRNIKRRQLNSDQKREALEKLLKIDPEKSNRAIAAVLGVAHTTVATVRKEVEATGGIIQLETTKGKDGKSRPTRKKINDTVLAAIAGTCLDTEIERAALVKLPVKEQRASQARQGWRGCDRDQAVQAGQAARPQGVGIHRAARG